MSKYNIYVEDVSVEAVFNKLGGVEGAKALLRGDLVVSTPTCRVLAEATLADVTMSTARKPLGFFVERPGLWVSESFKEIARNAKVLDAGTTINLQHQHIALEGGATDARAESALGSNHLFDEAVLPNLIAEMISAQEGGKSGLMLNNGYTNLFYLSGCVVNVHWSHALGTWAVSTWERDGSRWPRDYRVFSLGN